MSLDPRTLSRVACDMPCIRLSGLPLIHSLVNTRPRVACSNTRGTTKNSSPASISLKRLPDSPSRT